MKGSLRLEILSAAQMQEIVDAYYLCPKCPQGTAVKGWAIDQQQTREGDVEEKFILDCGHFFADHGLPHAMVIIHNHDIRLYAQVDIRDPDGTLTSRLFQRSRSFLVPFMAAIQMDAFGSTGTTFLAYNDTGGVSRNLGNPCGMQWQAAASVVTNGLEAGTGSTANSTTTNTLATAIANGTGSGQLQYGAVAIGSVAAGATTTGASTRVLTNGSTGNITVTEIGIYSIIPDTASTNRNVITARDVLGVSKTINSGGATATITYSIQFTVA